MRMRRFLPFVVAGALLVAAPALASPSSAGADEGSLTARANGDRTSRGLGALGVSGDLVAVARQHSQEMASQNRLYDDPYVGRRVSGWQRVGENVGVGSSADQVHQAFMASAPHRANILGAYTQIGVGVVWSNGRIWVTEVFRMPAGAAPAPIRRPAPPRASRAAPRRVAPPPPPPPPPAPPPQPPTTTTTMPPAVPHVPAHREMAAMTGAPLPVPPPPRPVPWEPIAAVGAPASLGAAVAVRRVPLGRLLRLLLRR